MEITILNGNPDPGSRLDDYLDDLTRRLEGAGSNVKRVNLREVDFSYCIGCFGCWVKTPGECSVADNSAVIHRAIMTSDFTLWAAPLRMGFPSSLLKKALDKYIPLIHPYFDVVQGEAHHRARYAHYPRLGLLLEPEPDTEAEDLVLVGDIFSRIALNFKSRLEFSLTTLEPLESLVESILTPGKQSVPFQRRLAPLPGQAIDPPTSLSLFNGSPRGRKGNTPILLSQFARGFTSLPGRSAESYQVNRLKQMERVIEAFANAECAWVGFPLYTDSMPGLVKEFFEALQPLRGRPNNPPVGFLVQSGFPEAAHSRHVERYLEKLAGRLGSPYLGTIVKGGGEGVRMMPDNMNRKLFDGLQGLGRGFAEDGQLDPHLLRQIAGVERYPFYMVPLFSLLVRLPLLNFAWDSQLKANQAYDRRFARPYERRSGKASFG
jgi:multimeric flavodoxin WrbA